MIDLPLDERVAHHDIDGVLDAGYRFIKNFIVIDPDLASGKLVLNVAAVGIGKDLEAVAVRIDDSLNAVAVLNYTASVIHVDGPAR